MKNEQMFADFPLKIIFHIEYAMHLNLTPFVHIFLCKGLVYDQSALASNMPLAMIWTTDDRVLWHHMNSHGRNKWTIEGCFGRYSDNAPSTYRTVLKYPILYCLR